MSVCGGCSNLLCAVVCCAVFADGGVAAQSLIRVGLGPPPPQRARLAAVSSALAACPVCRASGIPSPCSLPVRKENHDRTADVCHVPADRWVCSESAHAHTRVETVLDITAPPLILHSTSHSHVNLRPWKKSQHLRSFGPRPRLFTHPCEKSSLPARSRL